MSPFKRDVIFEGRNGLRAYEGETVYVVEVRPWEDRSYADGGMASRSWHAFLRWAARRRAAFWAGPFRRTKSSSDPIDRYHYSLKTGVLAVYERVWVKRDIRGRIVAPDASLAGRHSTARLAEWRHGR